MNPCELNPCQQNEICHKYGEYGFYLCVECTPEHKEYPHCKSWTPYFEHQYFLRTVISQMALGLFLIILILSFLYLFFFEKYIILLKFCTKSKN